VADPVLAWPRESSGASVHPGAISKTGNRHLRRLLTQAPHRRRHRPAVGAALRRRRAGKPVAVIALAETVPAPMRRAFFWITAQDLGAPLTGGVVEMLLARTG
jgi:transposase